MSDHDDGLEVDLGDLSVEPERDSTEVVEETTEETESTEDTSSGYVETDDPKVKARLGQMTREKWEAIRAKEKAEREANTLRQELQSLKAPKTVEPPSADLAIDDPDAFKAQQAKYAEFVKQQAVHESETKRSTEAIKAQEQATLEQNIAEYTKRAAALKISKEELVEAGTTVGQSGIAKEVVEYLLTHDNGPAIVKQLASRPDDLYQLATMPAHKATAQIERLFAGQKRTQNDPPPPPPRINGVRTSGTKAADGTTYE